MKKRTLLLLLSIALLMGVVMPMSVSAANQPAILLDPSMADVKGTPEVFNATLDDAWHVKATGLTPRFNWIIKDSINHSAEKYPVVSMMLRNYDGSDGMVFYYAGDKKEPDAFQFEFWTQWDDEVCRYYEDGNDTYTLISTDLSSAANWMGRINGVSISFNGENGMEFDICYVGFFTSVQESLTYGDAYVSSGGKIETEPHTLLENMPVSAEACRTIVSQRVDDFSPKEYPVVGLLLKNYAGIEGVLQVSMGNQFFYADSWHVQARYGEYAYAEVDVSLFDHSVKAIDLAFWTNLFDKNADNWNIEYVAGFDSSQSAKAYAEAYLSDKGVDTSKSNIFEPSTYGPACIDTSYIAYQRFDELYINGNPEDGVFEPGASDTWNGKAVVSGNKPTLNYFGWAGYVGNTGVYGYAIDDGEAIFDEAYTMEAEEDVLNFAAYFGAKNATRMNITIDLSAHPGVHQVKTLCGIRNADGEIEKVITLSQFAVYVNNPSATETTPDGSNGSFTPGSSSDKNESSTADQPNDAAPDSDSGAASVTEPDGSSAAADGCASAVIGITTLTTLIGAAWVCRKKQ